MTVAEVEAVAQVWSDGIANRDAAAIADLYSDDAKLLAPNAEPIEGRAEIQGFLDQLMQMGAKSMKLEPLDVKEDGDIMVEYGRYTMEIEPEGEDATTDVGKYIVVHERQDDGSTKMVLDIFNTNAPAD
jgi:uncharacterized protein (TIGR02246 family)